MGVPFGVAQNSLDDAVKQLYHQDPRVRAVGIGQHSNGFGYHVIRNAAKILPQSVTVGPPLPAVQNVPVVYFNRQADPARLVKLPASGPGSPTAASFVPEQANRRPLVCGLQIQNYEDDHRTGTIAGGHIIIGTLGCFAKRGSGAIAILSNNHVVAGENRGIKGTDRITQPGTAAIAAGDQVATLTDFVALNPSPAGATPAMGTAVLNDVDAGIAELGSGIAFHQAYLASRALAAPAGTAVAAIGDHVYKVGRTTGLTRGVVTSVAAVVGPVPYDPGECWFRRTFIIEGDQGTMFSDQGDSGSAIIKDGTGEVLGLLFAGNGTDTFACPIDAVLTAFACSLA